MKITYRTYGASPSKAIYVLQELQRKTKKGVKKQKSLLQEIMAENFPNLKK